jgi:type II restriction/modification system DNA methylase subunit YeeA
MPPITLPVFVQRWTASTRTERAASQEHFIDLCRLLNQQTPNEADPTGDWYAFEKGTQKVAGGAGFADVWQRDHFAWEYKGKHKDLVAAYMQLLKYREDLENPPLLVVCDLDRFEVHTNFTNTTKAVYAFDLADLAAQVATATCPIPPLEVLRALFIDPSRLRPQQTPEQVTEEAAEQFAALATSLRQRGVHPEVAAHFLMRLLFCQFAQDIGLLPRHLFTELVEHTLQRPAEFAKRLRTLFGQMATGGFFGVEDIAYFNGGLFADDVVQGLSVDDMRVLTRASHLDWASVEPAIFGTLFERSLDPGKRAQIGAHYTSRDDILLVVEPVLMAPLRARWATVQQQAQSLIAERDAARGRPRDAHQTALQRLLAGFTTELAAVRVLDPACGSGNFLYVALKRLLDLEKEVITFAIGNGVTAPFLQVGPEQLHGIELNAYAYELAAVVVWIGYIQWLHDNGFGTPTSPVLKPLHNIMRQDAVLAHGDHGALVQPVWPQADVVIGNPPFLGGKQLRKNLGDQYVDDLFALYEGEVPHEADLVTYWFERARALIAAGDLRRAGLLATQGIRGGANRKVVERIKETGDIFMAWSDRQWVLEGANVRVSMIGFDDGTESARMLNGAPVRAINANLTSALDLTQARRLAENVGLSFMGDTKGGPFDITGAMADTMLSAPLNPNGRPNSDVVRPWVNGLDITRRPRGMWIVDFGTNTPEADAALYELPFAHLEREVKPARASNKRDAYRDRWWIHAEPRPAMRQALASLARYIITPNLTKYRLFEWARHPTLPDHQLIVMARADDYFFGVLHSKVHELWALRMGTALEDRPRYTSTTTFETFPLPWPPGCEPAGDARVEAIAAAARALTATRDAWLNPPGATDDQLAVRTLTKLYNERPAFIEQLHRKLDEAVLSAYGWPQTATDDEILAGLLSQNQARPPA